MYKINDEQKTLSIINNDGTETVLTSFIGYATLKDTKYTLYAYVDIVDDKLYVKFGEAKDQSVYSRYARVTGSKATDRMIAVWESDKGDKEIHSKLRLRAKNLRSYVPADRNILNTQEAYEITSEVGLKNILQDITEYAESKDVATRQERNDYQDVVNLVTQVIDLYKSGNSKYILDLCTRFGKTGTFCRLYKELNKLDIRIHILGSYIGTVKTSYSQEINTLKNNEDCLFVDPDNYADSSVLAKEMKNWLKDQAHYVCYYLALTGDEEDCFARRVKALEKVKSYNKSITVEEADFGAGCAKQISKIRKLYNRPANNYKALFATTGTHAEKCERIVDETNAITIRRDYILDVLNKRDNAVGINWYCLNNAEMVKVFEYTRNEMENFADMFKVENGMLKGELWFRDTVNFLFNKMLPVMNKETRKYRNHNLLDTEAATMIFTPNSRVGQVCLKNLIETICPGYIVRVINGDETTNAKAEAEVRQLIKDCGHKVILIASAMANRSFSIPEIKNVLLFCNAGLPDQKIARGLTPWKGHFDKRCNIIDFRLAYEESNLSTYMQALAIDSLADTATHVSKQQILDEIKASDKLAFYEYFTSGADPIKELTLDDIKLQMNSMDYEKAKAVKIVEKDIYTIDFPDNKFNAVNEPINFNNLVNSNIKGDADRAARINSAVARTKSKQELSKDQRIQYLGYLINHKDEFNSGKYETNILENEFKYNMPKVRKEAIEKTFGIDMKVMSQIANLLIKNEVIIYN